MQVRLVRWTGTLAPMYVAARLCYSRGIPQPLEDEGEMEKWLEEKVIGRGHMGLLEHVDFHFLVEGVSRVLSHQLVRHRIASYCQQSQRCVNMDSVEFVVPPSVMQQGMRATEEFLRMCDAAKVDYNWLMRQGIPAEDARYILPNAAATNILVKQNGRALAEMSQKRLCSHAQWEFRAVVREIREEVIRVCPLVARRMVPPCDTCTEPKCGR